MPSLGIVHTTIYKHTRVLFGSEIVMAGTLLAKAGFLGSDFCQKTLQIVLSCILNVIFAPFRIQTLTHNPVLLVFQGPYHHNVIQVDSIQVLVVLIHISLVVSTFCNSTVPVGFLPWEIWIAFPRKSQLQPSHTTQPRVHAGCFSVSIIHLTLTQTPGSLTCI